MEIQETSLVRAMSLDKTSLDQEAGTIRASLSSEYPVERPFGLEILRHDEEAIDLSRATDGLPLLDGHGELVGRIEDVSLDADKKVRGTLRFSQNTQRGREIVADVRDGFLRDMSMGYRIIDWQESSGDRVEITRWQPYEASVVSVPADPTVGLNRSMRAAEMPKDEQGGGAAHDESTVSQLKEVRARTVKEGIKQGRELERKRASELRALFSPYLERGSEYIDLLEHCIENGVSRGSAAEMLLELRDDDAPIQTQFVQREDSMQERSAPKFSRKRESQQVEVRADDYDRFVDGIEASVMVRANLANAEQKQAVMGSEFRNMTLAEVARAFCDKRNVSLKGLSRDQVVARAFTMERAIDMRAGMINTTGSDFANLLTNIANKALQVGYEESEETWSLWCAIGSTSDFKMFDRPNLSGFSDLDMVSEGAEYKYGKFVDEKESARLATYGKLFSISRQAIINDDLNAFSTVPRAMGRAAARMVGDQVYLILTSNPNMADGNPLFDAQHSNENTTPTAPTVQSIDDIRVAMQLQTDPNGNTVGISPAYLLCPLQLQGTCQVLQRDQYDPAGTAGTLTSNIVQGTFQTVAERRLSQDSAVDWYMTAGPNSFSTVEVTFLDGQQAPFLDEQDGWNVDGAEYKVRLDCVAKALNWRGMYKQTGA